MSYGLSAKWPRRSRISLRTAFAKMRSLPPTTLQANVGELDYASGMPGVNQSKWQSPPPPSPRRSFGRILFTSGSCGSSAGILSRGFPGIEKHLGNPQHLTISSDAAILAVCPKRLIMPEDITSIIWRQPQPAGLQSQSKPCSEKNLPNSCVPVHARR